MQYEAAMPKLSETQLASLMTDDAPHMGQCALMLLAMWMTKFGGGDPEEMLNSFQEAKPYLTHHERKELISSVSNHDLASLQLACEVISSSPQELKIKTLEIMCSVAVADGYLTLSEHEFLLFLVSMLGFQHNTLENVFKNVTDGCSLPELPLPDDVLWWQRHEGKQEQYRENTTTDERTYQSKSSRLHDLGLLGLDEGATIEEIRRAYMRLAQIHHPDKYQVLGQEAMREAEASFSRIKAAYERLTNA